MNKGWYKKVYNKATPKYKGQGKDGVRGVVYKVPMPNMNLTN